MTFNVDKFLIELQQLDIYLWVEDGQLAFDAPEDAFTDAIRDQVLAHKQEIMQALLSSEIITEQPIDKAARTEALPLSFAQQRLWFLDQLEPLSALYNISMMIRLEGELDVAALEQSFSYLIARHESLRTTFDTVGGDPIQVIHEPTPFRLSQVVVSAPAQAQSYANTEAKTPFNLTEGPLLRVQLLRYTDQMHWLILNIHHIISDGWSMGVLVKELSHAYTAYAEGNVPTLPDLPIQYADFAVWQRDYLTGDILERQLSFWREELTGAPSQLTLPTDRPRPPVQLFKGADYTFHLSRELTEQLNQLAVRHDATLFMVLLSAFNVLLSRYSRQTDIVIGTPIANRNLAEIEGLIGFFVNTLPLRTQLDDNPSFTVLLNRVRESTLAAYEHQDLPFEQLVDELELTRTLSYSPLFQVMFALQNAKLGSFALSGVRATETLPEFPFAKFDLTLNLMESREGLVATQGLRAMLEYSTDLFDEATIARMANHFKVLLNSIVSQPSMPVMQLPMLTDAEYHQIVYQWNDSTVDFGEPQTIHALFSEQVERTPDAVALVFEDQQLTYAELNARANQLAHHLISKGVQEETLVAIAMERSLEMVISLLAILKAGGAYVPIDPSYPNARIAYMLTDSAAPILLTQSELSLDDIAEHVVMVDRVGEQLAFRPTEDPETSSKPEHLAYVIYTSGSTGQPKGVTIPHQNLFNLVLDNIKTFDLSANARVMHAPTFGFDVEVGDLFMTLCSGATLYLPAPGRVVGDFLRDQLLISQATHVSLTPTALSTLPPEPYPHLQMMIVAGEALPNTLAQNWLQFTSVWNAYGPTENTIYTTATRCQAGTKVHIGKPLSNVKSFILDHTHNPVPVGVPGELYIGGIQLARGYLNRPELTARAYIEHPEFGRLYKTGDLCRWLPDGNIEFMGRTDFQVKIRGFRIELGEIENVLLAFSGVREAVVLAREDLTARGDKRLVAYFVGDANSDTLRQQLAQRLPDYMIPSAFVELEAMPLTPNGKLDRRALPVPNYADVQTTYVPPRNELEQQLADIWAGVLGVEQVGIHDDFFALGGHSLLATQVISRVRAQLNLEVPLKSLFEASQLATFARNISQAQESTTAIIRPVARDRQLPLSFAQQRLWFLDQLGSSIAYNMPMALDLRGPLNVTVLQQTLQEIVRRHESLRTTFAVDDGTPYQVIHPEMTIDLPVIDLSVYSADEQAVEVKRLTAIEATHPFELSCDAMLRARLLKLSDIDLSDTVTSHHILLLIMHHIASDGWSLGVLMREMSALYAAFSQDQSSPLSDLPIQYADFAIWQRNYLQEEGLAQLLAYWKERLAGIPPLLQLPTDHPRPAQQSFQQGMVQVETEAELLSRLRRLSQEQGATLYMTLLAAFQVLMSRYSGQADVVVGSPIANRNRQELEPLIGFCANILVLRANLSKSDRQAPSFLEVLAQTKKTILSDHDHQELPFYRLVEELQLTRNLGYNPLVQVLFALQNPYRHKFEIPGLTVTDVLSELSDWTVMDVSADLDLQLHLWEVEGRLSGFCIFNAELFNKQTIKRMVTDFQTLLRGIVENPDHSIASLTTNTRHQEYANGPTREHEEIERCLLQSPAVHACCVVTRMAEMLGPKPIAYVVPRRVFSAEELETHLRALLSVEKLPYAYVPVSSLPLTSNGEIDLEALQAIPVIDHNLPLRWENHLQALPEITQVAVVPHPWQRKITPLHLAKVLPDWQTTVSQSNTPVGSVRQQAIVESEDSEQLSISHGPPLLMPEDAPRTLAEVLVQAAQQRANKGIIYIDHDGMVRMQSYAELLEEAQRILAGLREVGLKPQDKVIFQFENNADFIPAFWACVLGGFIPVPIAVALTYNEQNVIVNKLYNAWQMLNQPVILTTRKLAPAIASAPRKRGEESLLPMMGLQIAIINDLRRYEADHALYAAQPDEMALMMLTSGSTGMPKGVMLSHINLISRSLASRQMNGFSYIEVSLNWMPLDHVAGLIYFHLRDVFLGCQQIQVPNKLILQDPLCWLDLIDQYRVTVTFAPNFAYGMVNECAAEIALRTWDLSSMRAFLNGAEAIVPKTALRFLRLLLPHGLAETAMVPAWGMTETSSGVTYARDFTLATISDADTFVEVGLPVPGVSIRIVDANNQVLPEESQGSLQIKGATVTAGYYQNPELNQDVFTNDGWFKTGDLGVIRQGALTIVGREKEAIIINGINYHAHEIEKIVEEVSGVEPSFTAAVAIRQADSTTDQLGIFFVPTSTVETEIVTVIQEIRRQIGRVLGITPAYLIPASKEQIPKTAIGKIQRRQLGQRVYTGVFDRILQHYDVLMENANTLPAWFHQKVWCAAPLSGVAISGQQRMNYLIFADALGLGQALHAALTAQGQGVVLVESAGEYCQIAANHYCVNPSKPDHYQRLLASLTASGDLAIDRILHLWTYDGAGGEVADLAQLEAAQRHGVYSLLHLVQALTKHNSAERSMELLVISDGLQPADGESDVAYAKAPLLGLLRTIPQELPWLITRHIDLEHAEVDTPVQRTTHLEQLQNELAVISKEAEVAYRGDIRLVPRLAEVDMSALDPQPLPFNADGFYLISGGLGGIGIEIARYLLTHHGTSLLLLGRTPPFGEKQRAYQELMELDGQVRYAAVDICDSTRLRQAVAATEAEWGKPLAGVLHLAGNYHEQLLTAETPETFATVLRPKVLGSWSLHQLLNDKPDALFISFSSLFGLLGGTAISAYAAANSFLDIFAHHQQRHINSYTQAWSMWNDIGMSRGYGLQALTRARGYQIIVPQQGLHSLLVSLTHGLHAVWVGLDGGHPQILRHLATRSTPLQKLTAYYTTQPEITATIADSPRKRGAASLALCDLFGTPSNCDSVHLESLPLSPNGVIDRTQLLLGKIPDAGAYLAPRTETEQTLAHIWQELLGITRVDVHDNFFALGGHSLLATQVISQIRQRMAIDLPLSHLFQTPTVAGLAALIDKMQLLQALEQESPKSNITFDEIRLLRGLDEALPTSFVPLRADGNRVPLFLIHAASGVVFPFLSLLPHLDSKQPVYALQARGIYDELPPFESIETLATATIEEIKTIQPHGPYTISGWSFGGIVAFEMARQLTQLGDVVSFLGVMDAYPTTLDQTISHDIPASQQELEAFRDLLGGIMNDHSLTDDLFVSALEHPEPVEWLLDQQRDRFALEPSLVKRIWLTLKHNVQLVQDYQFQPYEGAITLFCAKEFAPEDGIQQWQALTPHPVDAVWVSGQHHTMLNVEHVETLGRELEKRLQQAVSSKQ